MLSIRQRIRYGTDDDDNNIITLDISCLMYDSGHYIIIYRMYRYNNPPVLRLQFTREKLRAASAHVIASLIYTRVYHHYIPIYRIVRSSGRSEDSTIYNSDRSHNV